MASLADAEEALRSTSAKANFQRLTRLLMCGGLRLLREIFDSIHSPADLPLKLGDPTIQTQLRGARLTQPERDCLNPSTGVYGKSTDFDITLIFKLLRTICNLTPPPGPRGWDDLPNSSDHSLEADLVRIKYYRNEVYAHSKTMEITDTEFNDLWRKISEALIRIAARVSREKEDEWKKSIAGFLHNELTPEAERYNEELKMWYMQDMDVKSEVEKFKEVFKTEMGELKEEVAKLVIIIESRITGSPMTPHESGESRGICAIPVANQQRAENDVSNSGELQLIPQDTPTEMQIWTVILSFKESFELFLQYLRYKLNVFVRSHGVGSLLITVECSSLQILQGLWEDYRSGHLNEIAQEMLVTAEVLEKLGLDEVRLKTFISEEEYENGKQIFKDISDSFKQKQKNLQEEIVELGARVEATEKTLKAISGQSRLPPGDAAGKSASQVEAGKAAVSEFAPGDVPGELTMPIQKEKDTGDDSDYLERMSILEEENRELKRRLIAIEDKLRGKESLRNYELDMRIMELENERQLFHIQLSDIKREIHSMQVAMAQKSDLDVPVSSIFAGGYHLPSSRRTDIEAMYVPRPSRLTSGYIAHKSASQAEVTKDTVSELVVPARDVLGEATSPIEKGLKDIGDDSGQGNNESRKIQQPEKKNILTVFSRRPSSLEHLPVIASRKFFHRIKGFCQVIVNRQKLEALDKEKMEFESVFKDLGFDVDEKVCEYYDDVEQVVNSVASRDYSNYNSFICLIQSNVTKDGELESSFGRSLGVNKLLAKLSFLKFSSRREAPKIFIIQGHQTTTALEADEPIDEKSVSMKMPVGETLCLFFPYRKGYIATLLSIIKLHGSKRRDILYILSEAKKLFYEINHITIPDPVHNLTGPVYLK